jgi:hypothetical protein
MHRPPPYRLVPAALLVAASAFASHDATVHVVLHPHATDGAAATFVDIDVHGTEVPIRLVRRVDGTCSVNPAAPPDAAVFVRVTCDAPEGAVTFEVARDGDALVVRRSAPASGDASANGPQVIARAALAPGSTVRVR